MSETKWTPGPWISGPISIESGWVDIDAVSGGRLHVGYTSPRRNGTPEERRDDETVANARLIAAAPELYEALNVVFHSTAVINHLGEVATDLVQAALAKARGEQP